MSAAASVKALRPFPKAEVKAVQLIERFDGFAVRLVALASALLVCCCCCVVVTVPWRGELDSSTMKHVPGIRQAVCPICPDSLVFLVFPMLR